MNLIWQTKITTDCGKRVIFDKVSDSYAKYYSLAKQLAVDKIIVLFKGRAIFKQYISKKHKWFGIKLYKLCESKEYTNNMSMYLHKHRKWQLHMQL